MLHPWVTEAYKKAWHLFKKEWVLLLPIVLLLGFIEYGNSLLSTFSQSENSSRLLSVLILSFLSSIAEGILLMALFQFGFSSDWLSPIRGRMILRYVIASTLFSLLIAQGLTLLFIPGIILLILYAFFPIFLASGKGVAESFWRSRHFVLEHPVAVLEFLFCGCLLAIISIVGFGLPLLITAPLFLLAASSLVTSHSEK